MPTAAEERLSSMPNAGHQEKTHKPGKETKPEFEPWTSSNVRVFPTTVLARVSSDEVSTQSNDSSFPPSSLGSTMTTTIMFCNTISTGWGDFPLILVSRSLWGSRGGPGCWWRALHQPFLRQADSLPPRVGLGPHVPLTGSFECARASAGD